MSKNARNYLIEVISRGQDMAMDLYWRGGGDWALFQGQPIDLQKHFAQYIWSIIC